MPEDELPRPDSESAAPGFELDDEAISTLLDNFVETQTGPGPRRASKPPNPDDAGALAAQRSVFQDISRHEALPLVGDSAETNERRIALLEALAERSVGSTRARLLTSAAELHERLGDAATATANYRQALRADARDVVVLRALRRNAMAREDWPAAVDALEKEAALGLADAERAAALKLLAQIQLSKLRDPAAAEQAARHAAQLRDEDFLSWVLVASARISRNENQRAAEALVEAAERWPAPDARVAILLHACELMERAGASEAAKSLYARVLEIRPSSLSAWLGTARVSRALGLLEEAGEALLAAAEQAPSSGAAALRRAAAVTRSARGDHAGALATLEGASDTGSLWTLAEIATASGDVARAIEALRSDAESASREIRSVANARRSRLHAELGDEAQRAEAARAAQTHPALVTYVKAWRQLLAEDGRALSDEEALLDAALGERESVASRMAQADDAARAADGAAMILALERELEAAPPSLRVGAALGIAECAEEFGLNDRVTALLDAEERAGPSPLLTCALTLVDADRERLAQRWKADAGQSNAGRGAFACAMAASLMPGTVGASDACESALEREPAYWPVLWMLEDDLDAPQVRAESAMLQARLDPENATAHSLRAALWASSHTERIAYAQMALDREAPDPLLIEHLVEEAGHGAEAAGDLMLLAGRASLSPSYFLRAASSYRLAGASARAAEALREAPAGSPQEHAIRARRKDAELHAGEYARLADAAMRRAREASSDAERLAALCEMAHVDRFARRDMQSARLSLQSIAEVRSDHLPTARALEWDALHERDSDRIRSSARRLSSALSPGSPDRVARHRLVVELLSADPDIGQSEVDQALCDISDELDADLGLARKVLGAAYAKGLPSVALRALVALQSTLDHDLERGALALDAAHMLEQMGDTTRALEALEAARSHPLALEEEARLLRHAKRWEDAAGEYEEAARRANDSRRAAALWREAARIYEDELRDTARAIQDWAAAALCDITYLDVYRRLAALYRAAGKDDALASLTDSRIRAGADTPTLVALMLEKAEQQRAREDYEGLVQTLHQCLELDPNHFIALKELTDAHRARGEWQGAAEALVRIALLKRSTDEQLWAFTQLAEIYHEHLQDLPRAEKSLRRAHELAPTHVETLDRLASVLTLRGEFREAARLLNELVRRAGSDLQDRDYRIRLASAVEGAGQARDAELILEHLRTERPTDPDVILAIADYYQRQGAGPAESMHLNRALNDLRAAVEARPGDEALWTTLVRVTHRRHGPGPASCVASAAIAVGHPAALFEGDVSDRGEAIGTPKLPLSLQVDGVVAPAEVPQTLRRLFALCEQSFDKAMPFDAGAWRLRKPSGAHRALIEEAGTVAQALGISEPHLRITYVAPAACMPISGDPPTLVLGGNLHDMTTPLERVFLFARALKVAGSHLAPALRARPEDLDTTLLALLQGHQASRKHGPESQQMLALRKKLLRAVPRRWRDEVESLVLELQGDREFSTRAVPFAISELGDRVALTLTGDVPSAVNALLKIAGHGVPASHAGRVDAIRETPEAWALVRFAMSDAHFEARAQAGVDL